MSLIKESQHLSIPYEDIEVATQNFTTVIGEGGYGVVYKGELQFSGKLTTVAVKRLGCNKTGQGFKEFLTEIQLLSRYKHPNLVSLLGFCEEGNERILVYEHAEKGSLDKYLSMAKTTCPLTWKQRIDICMDAAQGLDYLHNHVAKNYRVIHRDIKSANVLLDQNLKAMIADLGLSKIGRANENETYLITNASGTRGYCDPAYIESGILTKKSDVYSFGVVLFEMLCGRLCFMNVQDERRFLVPLVQRYYKKGKLNDIIDPGLKNQMDSESMKKFSEIAYHCLQDDRELRPSMSLVVRKLKEVLELQELELGLKSAKKLLEEAMGSQEFDEAMGLQEIDQMIDYEVINRMTDIPSPYTLSEELPSHLSTGVLVNRGKVWFSIDDRGKNQEMISSTKFMHLDGRNCTATSAPESRFLMVAKILDASKLDMQVKIKTRFLSLGVTYAAYLVVKTTYEISEALPFMMRLKYKINATSETHIAYPRELIDNGWMMMELFQTINCNKNVCFKLVLEGIDFPFPVQTVVVEGIKFLPVQKLDDEEIEKQEVHNLPTSELEWESRLPSDYKQFLYGPSEAMMTKRQVDVKFPTKEEAYNILCSGLHIKVKGVDMWFWITKSNGKKCFMLSPESISEPFSSEKTFQLHSGSSNLCRFEYILEISPSLKVTMEFKMIYPLLSTKTSYACYLVYKMPEGRVFETPVSVKMHVYHKDAEGRYLGIPSSIERGSDGEKRAHSPQARIMYLSRPQVPVIGADGERRYHSLNKLKMIEFPRERQDGWWEVNLGEFISDYEACDLTTSSPDDDSVIIISMISAHERMPNLTVQGIEFRPL